jgi:hypothetical protein
LDSHAFRHHVWIPDAKLVWLGILPKHDWKIPISQKIDKFSVSEEMFATNDILRA